MSALRGTLILPAALPQEGTTYADARGRALYVDAVQLGDPLGRDVVGVVATYDRGEMLGVRREHYATDVATWAHVWRDKDPPADRSKMKVGG